MRRLTLAVTLAIMAAGTALAATVRVEGAVNQPADVQFKEGMRVRHALELAGGLTSDADPKKVEVLSGNGATRVVDLTPLTPSPMLSPDDTVKVPVVDRSEYVFVRGAVSRPGQVVFTEGMTIAHALIEAAPYDESRVDNIKVIRNLENGETETITLAMSEVHAGVAENVELAPGDMIEVAYPTQMRDRELITLVVIGLLLIILLRR